MRISKVYTRTGDSGKTRLAGGQEVWKDAVRVEAYGTVDELSAVIGVARATELPAEVDEVLQRMQHQLFALGAQLATPDPEDHGTQLIGTAEVAWVEDTIDQFDGQLPALKNFVLPAGTSTAYQSTSSSIRT